MREHETKTASLRGRRRFLQVGGAVAAAFAAPRHAHGQVPSGLRAAGPPDRALWVTWYDLPDAGRERYLSWLHETHLPSLLKRPGYLWASHYAVTSGVPSNNQITRTDDPSVGTGYHYILIVGAEGPEVFGNAAPSAIKAQLPEQGLKMLAMRAGERTNIMSEAGRCEGRSATSYPDGLTGAPCIQIGSFNCPFQGEEELHAGYLQRRLPAMCETASCIRTRKMTSVAGWAKHMVLYEFTSFEGYMRDYPVALDKTPLGTTGTSMVARLTHAPHSPNAALRLWPPVPGI